MNEKIMIVEDQFVEANSLRLILRKAGYEVCTICRSVEQAREVMKEEQPGLALVDIYLRGALTGIDLARDLKEAGIPFIYISANSNEEILSAAKTTQPEGFVVKPFRKKDVLVTLEIAKYRHMEALQTDNLQQRQLQQHLNTIVKSNDTVEQQLLQMARALRPLIPFDYVEMRMIAPAGAQQYPGFLRTGFDEYQLIGLPEMALISRTGQTELRALQQQAYFEDAPCCYNGKDFIAHGRKYAMYKLLSGTFGLHSHLNCPLVTAGQCIFHLSFFSRRPDAYPAECIAAFDRIRPVLAAAIDKITGQAPPQAVDTVMPARHTNRPGFEGIIGNHHLLLDVFEQITQVAPHDTSILVLGESGTGKEGIAEAIHRHSPRARQPLVKVNCAALPPTLIESELFGHEKGAFTGALEKRTGKFEQAHHGTLFLDEIGEMPADLQVKLLRVLQEREIERIGSKSPMKIDVRIIAATNRNLEKEVAEGRFRLDLYYRLNVFPVTLPALRERTDDIPALTLHFIDVYNRRAGKNVRGVTDKVMQQMLHYTWPGNIRELEHLVERGVLLAKGPMIEEMLMLQPKQVAETRTKTIQENERDYIIAVLKKCNGKIWGPGAAAELLNIPPSTLKSRMKKLGIPKEIAG